MEKKNTTLAIILAVIGGLCLCICLGTGLAVHFWPNNYQYSLENSSLNIGDPAPDFELTSLNGEAVRLSQFKGQPVLLSISATWCPDCRLEAPQLQELHEKHPELVVLGIDSGEGADVVRDFADEFGITYPLLLDQDRKVMEMYQVFAIPTNLFVDVDGIIRAKIIEQVTPELLAEKLPLIGIEP